MILHAAIPGSFINQLNHYDKQLTEARRKILYLNLAQVALEEMRAQITKQEKETEGQQQNNLNQ